MTLYVTVTWLFPKGDRYIQVRLYYYQCYYYLYNNPSHSSILIGSHYDLLEDRCMIDVIITKCLCFKMAEISGNLYNILRDWAKEKIKKILVDAFNR